MKYRHVASYYPSSIVNHVGQRRRAYRQKVRAVRSVTERGGAETAIESTDAVLPKDGQRDLDCGGVRGVVGEYILLAYLD